MYAAARATWSAAQERAPQARAGLLPLASLSASAQYNDRSTRFRDDLAPRTESGFGSTGLSLSVSQPLYRAQNAIAYNQALTQAEQADAQLALAAQDLMLRVAQAYFDILLAEDTVALAQTQTTAIGQQLGQAKRNFEVGTTSITDMHEAQARYDLSIAQEIAARNDLQLRMRVLEQLIGRAAPPLAPLGAGFSIKPPDPASMDTWVDLARERNLQVRIAQGAWQFSTQEISRNRAAHYPTLDAFVTLSSSGSGAGTTNVLGVSTAGGVGTDTRSAVAGVQLTLPIYQGGLITSRVREAISNESRAIHELESARRSAALSAQQGFIGITSSIAQANALQAALVSTQSQLDSTRLGRDVGVRTQVDVLNAQQLLFNAQRDLAQARYTYVISLLRLEAAVGGLTEDDLVAVNRWLGERPSAAGGSAPVAAMSPPLPTTGPAAPRRELSAALPGAAPADNLAAAVLDTVDGWARAWASNDVRGYLSYYAPDFQTPRGLTRDAWEAERTRLTSKPRRIAVALEAPVVKLDGNTATVTFRQQYRSGRLDIVSDKTLVLVQAADRWLIQRETIQSETRR